MAPDHPPLPTPINLPFQFCPGNQTSILISESDVGLTTAATRQNAGKRSNAACCAGERFGRVKAPAATVSALVIVASASASVERLSQVAANAAGMKRASMASFNVAGISSQNGAFSVSTKDLAKCIANFAHSRVGANCIQDKGHRVGVAFGGLAQTVEGLGHFPGVAPRPQCRELRHLVRLR